MPLQSVAFFFQIGITQQKNRTIIFFGGGLGDGNRHPIGGLGENPPILLASLISVTKSNNVCETSIYSRGHGVPIGVNLSLKLYRAGVVQKPSPSSPNPFSRRRRGIKSLAPLSWWATVYTQVVAVRVSGVIDPLNCHYERSDSGAK